MVIGFSPMDFSLKFSSSMERWLATWMGIRSANFVLSVRPRTLGAALPFKMRAVGPL